MSQYSRLPLAGPPRGFAPGREASLDGTIERITFQNVDSGFVVARFRVQKTNELVTVVGSLSGVQKGEDLQIHGVWNEDPRFGPQLQVRRFEIQLPTSGAGLRDYLTTFHNIGPSRAKSLVEAFGEDLSHVIDHEPERLRGVKGITRAIAKSLKEEWTARGAERQVMVFCQSFGITANQARRIFKTYGDRALRILTIEGNPYQLAEDVFGIGFRKADEIALKLGIQPDDPRRVQAALRYTLVQGADDGHTYLPLERLFQQAATELPEVDTQRLTEALGDLLHERRVIADPHLLPARERPDPSLLQAEQLESACPIFLPQHWDTEQKLVRELKRRLETPAATALPPDRESRMQQYRERQGLELSDEQLTAIRESLLAPVFLLTGGPGTGKSTCLKLAVDVLEHERARVALAAPTGRAARRLTETTGRPASTLHRLLEFQPAAGGFQRNAETPLECDVVIVDEVSMLDAQLAAALFAALPAEARLILVGDPDQLPSVGAGNVLADLIASDTVPRVHLTRIYRQAQTSQIVVNAHRINAGEMPDLEPQAGQKRDFRFFSVSNDKDLAPQEAKEKLVRYLTEVLSQHVDLIRQVQVLTPMHHGPVGARALNPLLQQTLNPVATPQDLLRLGEREFRLGDRVMQMRNNYDKDVFNGDIGFVSRIDREKQECVINFEQPVTFTSGELDEVQLAYAITVHKSQGSEFPVVVMPLVTQHYMMLRRNLLYTAITRARKLVILIGQRKALWIAVQRGYADEDRRCTGLAPRLRQALGL